jgi:hypothetical protein
MLALLAFPPGEARAAPSAAPSSWSLTLQQVGKDGGAVGTPVQLSCPSAGCATSFPLILGEATRDIHVQVDYVARGAYLTLEQRSPNIRAVMDFTTGHKGPIFVPLRRPTHNTMLVQLLVASESDAGNPVLAEGAVFNAKVRPDAYLRVAFDKPNPG